ncbi:MAG: hypothetical protein ABID71_09030 [Chloroflexota bacterium]
MQLNPWLFALVAYVTAAVITVCVAFIVRIIALVVQRKKSTGEG